MLSYGFATYRSFYGNMVQFWKHNGTNIQILLHCKVSQNFTQTRIGTTNNISVTSVPHENGKICVLIREYDFLTMVDLALVDALQILLTTLSANFGLRRLYRNISSNVKITDRFVSKLYYVIYERRKITLFLCIFLYYIRIDWNHPPTASSSIQQRAITKLDIFA